MENKIYYLSTIILLTDKQSNLIEGKIMPPQNIAVILAGGIGSRLGESRPKQLLKVAGKTVIEHTVDVFEKSENIHEIAIVAHPDIHRDIEKFILQNHWTKVRKVLSGGSERYESSLSAITAYANLPGDTNIIFHDAVRPLVTSRIINDTISALDKYDAVDVAIPSADTIIQVETDGENISTIPDRRYLYRGQTPQGFKLNTIKEAYALALEDLEFRATDDCGVVAKYLPDVKIGVVRGEEKNIKLTYPEDVYLLDKLFQINSINIKSDFDFHPLKGKCIVVFGGNSGIGASMIEIAEKYGAKCYAVSRSLSGVDVSDKKQVENCLNSIAEEYGKIDYVVNSAAILKKEPLMGMEDTTIHQIIDTNYFGVVNVAMSSYPYLKESKGQLLFFTSSSYTRGRAFYSLYSSTKAAVVNFVQAIAEEWEGDGISVNCINPERTSTPMRISNFGVEEPSTLLSAENVAKVALGTLLSDITGQVVDVKVKDFQ